MTRCPPDKRYCLTVFFLPTHRCFVVLLCSPLIGPAVEHTPTFLKWPSVPLSVDTTPGGKEDVSDRFAVKLDSCKLGVAPEDLSWGTL